MTTALIILAAVVALSILVLLWLCSRAPVVEETDMSWPGHAFRVIDHDPLPPLEPSPEESFRFAEGA